MERFIPDYARPIRASDDSEPMWMSPRYDAIHGFKWIGHAILRVVCNDSMAHIHVDYETAQTISQYTGIPITEYEFMLESDHQNYLQAQADHLDDSWLEDE